MMQFNKDWNKISNYLIIVMGHKVNWNLSELKRVLVG